LLGPKLYSTVHTAPVKVQPTGLLSVERKGKERKGKERKGTDWTGNGSKGNKTT